MKKQILGILGMVTGVILSTGNANGQTGTWTAVKNFAPNNCYGVMLLLTDGTVICKDDGGNGYGTGWNRLTPDNKGSYVNGTWSNIASMNYDRLFFAKQVLPNGKVFASGGEYGGGATRGEVYDPIANTWTNTNTVGEDVYDGNSEILSTGVVLVGPQAGPNNGKDNLFYTPSSNNWATAPNSPLDHDEAAWLKLPDGSILFVGIGSTKSCRYIPGTNTWVNDANLPVSLYDNYGSEMGGAYMLPNGKAVFFGATTHNAIYTPSGTSAPGTWTAAADYPMIGTTTVGQIDASGAMMVNGHILLAVSPSNSNSRDQFRSPFWFLEYDYTTNTFTQVTSVLPNIAADSVPGQPSNFSNFLDLPDGTVLFGISEAGINEYWVYTPGSGSIPQGIPTINSVYETSCGVYKATGKLFNGISEGAGFGDDWQMSTNYPIIRLTNGTNTYYCRTTNWNRIGAVQTDSLEDTVQFTLPAGLPSGTYSLVVTANGFASNPTLFTPLASNGGTITGTTCNGGSDGSANVIVTGGVSPYTYKWSNGTSTVSTSNPSGNVLSAGTYTVTITDNIGCTTSATVSITQPSIIRPTPRVTNNVSCFGGNNGSVSATPTGGAGTYTYAWSGGGTNSTNSGLSAGTYTITVTDMKGCTQTATIAVTQPTALALVQGTKGTATPDTCNGSAWVTVSGGTSSYTYSWNTGPSTDTITNLCDGWYCCKVTDKNGCTDSICFSVVTGVKDVRGLATINIYPNPNNGVFTIESTIVNGQSSVEVYTVLGEQVLIHNLIGTTNEINLSKQPSGIYLYKIHCLSGDIVSLGKFVIQT